MMAKAIVSKKPHKLNLSCGQFNAFRTMILTGYRMAKFLSNDEIKQLNINGAAIKLVDEWHSAA